MSNAPAPVPIPQTPGPMGWLQRNPQAAIGALVIVVVVLFSRLLRQRDQATTQPTPMTMPLGDLSGLERDGSGRSVVYVPTENSFYSYANTQIETNNTTVTNPAVIPAPAPVKPAAPTKPAYEDRNRPGGIIPGGYVPPRLPGQVATGPGGFDLSQWYSEETQASIGGISGRTDQVTQADPPPAVLMLQPACNDGNFSCIKYNCAPGDMACAERVAPWYKGQPIGGWTPGYDTPTIGRPGGSSPFIPFVS